MRLDIYQAEMAQLAWEQSSLLDEARRRLLADETLSRLEQNGLLHALQLLIENAIGKAKQILKAKGEPVPVSAYDAIAALEPLGVLDASELAAWNAAIGLRNRIVHEYLNIDMTLIIDLIRRNQYQFIVTFLMAPIDS